MFSALIEARIEELKRGGLMNEKQVRAAMQGLADDVAREERLRALEARTERLAARCGIPRKKTSPRMVVVRGRRRRSIFWECVSIFAGAAVGAALRPDKAANKETKA